MKDFLFVVVILFLLGILSIVLMIIALSSMIKYAGGERKKGSIVFMLIFPVLSVICGAFAAYAFFGLGVAIATGIVLFIIAAFVWIGYFAVSGNRKKNGKKSKK